jgi:hypothetical protein
MKNMPKIAILFDHHNVIKGHRQHLVGSTISYRNFHNLFTLK